MPQSTYIVDADGTKELQISGDGSLNAILRDKDNLPTEFDTAGSAEPNTYGYLVAIDLPHHKIHEESHYFWSDYDNNVAIAGPKYWRVKTPAIGRVHMTWIINCSLNGLVELYENPTINAAGTTKTAYNSDRNSTETSTVTHYYDSTTTADGTLLKSFVLGSDGVNPVGADGGNHNHTEEIILKADEDYVFKYTAGTDNSRVTLNLEYYIVPTT